MAVYSKTKLNSMLRLRASVRDISDVMDCCQSITRSRKYQQPKVIRVGVFSDFHSGHNMGLTPPAYQYRIIPNAVSTEHKRRNKWAIWQADAWDWFKDTIQMVQPFDIALIVGDCIDGSGRRSGGTELITTDRKVQCHMAIEICKAIGANKYLMVFGTPYHTGQEESFEIDVAKELNAKIGTHEWLNVFGCIIDMRHYQSNTINPFSSLMREFNNNRKWAEAGEQPVSNVIIRAHTHRGFYARWQDCLLISNPSMQGWSRYGTLMMSNKVDFGFTVIEIWPDGYPECFMFTAKITSQKIKVSDMSNGL